MNTFTLVFVFLCVGVGLSQATHNTTCAVCSDYAAALQNTFNTYSNDQINALIESVCDNHLLIKKENREECLTFKKSIPFIRTIMSNSPNDICALGGMCPYNRDKRDRTPKNFADLFGNHSKIACDVCDSTLKDVREATRKHSRVEVEDFFYDICHFSMIKPEKQQKCTEIVEYLGRVIVFALDDLPPRGVCDALGVCPLF